MVAKPLTRRAFFLELFSYRVFTELKETSIAKMFLSKGAFMTEEVIYSQIARPPSTPTGYVDLLGFRAFILSLHSRIILECFLCVSMYSWWGFIYLKVAFSSKYV